MQEESLPGEFVDQLNSLGFALVAGDQPYTLVRFVIGGEIRLLAEASGPGRWRVGLAYRAADQPGKMPNPAVPMSLKGFGPSSDGITLDVSGAELGRKVPALLRRAILPMYDLGES